ncbi:NAD(P)/FAD-dependent oxidoreductase [Methylotetracoccus oryzae]|uniref:NAD(P)/FAD-dependent oxidoreductase n=1 Tax=Methylotetracoccus oryzae TaxID=1919059 RepID=UPI00111A9920|nr:FAD/NAD(P)-binding oxidoreductase [Methylotetracoccus oryzae]
MDIKRRNLLRFAGLGAAATAAGIAPTLTRVGAVEAAPVVRKVVVIGGGFGGSTVAKYLKLWGQAQVEVTHVSLASTYVSPILSNLVLNGQKSLASLTFNLQTAATKLGIRFVAGSAAIDRGARLVRVTHDNGTETLLDYDKVVLSPGIAFNTLPSMLAANRGIAGGKLPIPHAWQAGPQVGNLKAQIDRMPSSSGVFVLCIPKAPYRCPPGPYERACVVADILKRVKRGGRVVIFDANAPTNPADKYTAIQAEQHTFSTAFTGAYGSIVEYVPNATLLEVGTTGGQFGTKTARVRLGDGSVRTQTCNVLNVLPEHKAGAIAFAADLIPVGQRFVPVDQQSYASLADPDIHVIGDAHDSKQPKAGHVANSEAKVCADAIVREFGILPPRTAEEVPVTNSACYSPISSTTASWLTVGFRYDPVSRQMVRIDASLAEAEQPSGDNYKMMLAWANNLFADTFSV